MGLDYLGEKMKIALKEITWLDLMSHGWGNGYGYGSGDGRGSGFGWGDGAGKCY
jgi:hypothetical protein